MDGIKAYDVCIVFTTYADSDDDALNPQISGLYPFTSVNDKDINGIRYNLLPKESDNQDDCYTPIGTFPAKREFLDNNDNWILKERFTNNNGLTILEKIN
jgi:hypothetical protein